MDKNFYKTIVNYMDEGVYFVDKHRRIIFWNKAAEDITGYKQDEVLGSYCQNNLLQHTDEEGNQLCLISCPLFASLGDGIHREKEVMLRHKNGFYIPVKVKVIPIYNSEDDTEIIGAIEIFSSTLPKRTQATAFDSFIEGELTVSGNDELTSLPNRRTLQGYINYKMENYKREKNMFGILFADIDNFREFNNKYGHEAGDYVLKTVAVTILSHIRDEDIFGRWGGEEFIGIFNLNKKKEIYDIGEKIRKLVEKLEINYKGQILSVTVSVGVTVVTNFDNFESIVDRADKFMYKSKSKGKNCVTAEG